MLKKGGSITHWQNFNLSKNKHVDLDSSSFNFSDQLEFNRSENLTNIAFLNFTLSNQIK